MSSSVCANLIAFHTGERAVEVKMFSSIVIIQEGIEIEVIENICSCCCDWAIEVKAIQIHLSATLATDTTVLYLRQILGNAKHTMPG